MTTLNPPFKAKDMKALFKKVVKGDYPDIPFHFSQDLGLMIAMCLRVSSTARPSADQLLQSREMKQKILYYHDEFEDSENINPNNAQDKLLQTIRMPNEMKNIKLPKSNYCGNRSTKRSHSHQDRKTNRILSLNPIDRKSEMYTSDENRRVNTSKLTLLK